MITWYQKAETTEEEEEGDGTTIKNWIMHTIPSPMLSASFKALIKLVKNIPAAFLSVHAPLECFN